MIGTLLASRYLVERQLGEGGMGRVFEAVDKQLGRRVAIKLIRDGLDDAAARERFLREARAAAAVSHPNTCQLHEVSEHDGQPFLVMELLEGESLSERLARGPIPKAEAVAMLLPLMSALAAFHDTGLIHRDIKPSNVFVTAQGVKLLDFGLARPTQDGDALTAPALTVPGAVTGTLRYMAPEQVTGDPVDARTDIFGLGVLLFEMLTGRVPFDAATNIEWLNAVLKEDAQSLESPELLDLDPVVTRALQRRPEDRYQTVGEMSAALEAVVQGHGAPATVHQAGVHEAGVQQAGPTGAEGHQRRTVILPFRLLQPDPEIEVLRDGIPEALTALLSNHHGVTLVSNRVAQEYSDATDLVAAGKALHVDRLLTGSILRAGDEVRVTVQLVDAADGSVTWSQTSQHILDSVLTLQDEACARIVEALPLAAESAPARG